MSDTSPPDAHDCALEPIRHAGAIQPHGYLLSCVLPDWTIRHVSANVAVLFDIGPDALLGESLREYLTEDLLQAIADVVQLAEPGAAPVRAAVGNVGPAAAQYDITVHVSDGLVHIELEPHSNRARDRTPSVVAQAMIARVATAPDMDDFYQRTAEQLRMLSGHDRVLVYRFLPDGAGEVVAESRVDDIESMLGLRFPESDIPAQARALYAYNRLRVIPDIDYEPVAIVPPLTDAGAPIDLSLHHLRSVSPLHLEYSRNMGVLATMSISIVTGGRLWGLIACHHRSPREVTATVRAAAELFGMFVSMRVSAYEQQRVAERDEQAREVQELLWRKLASTRDLDTTLAEELDSLGRALSCDGVAVLLGDRWYHAGRAPSQAPEAMLSWLGAGGNGSAQIIATDRASDWNGADVDTNHLAGLLAMRLGSYDDLLLFFRQEQIEDVRWAGEPVKLTSTDGARVSIRPRARFEAWREIIRGRSVPWSDLDRRTAERLRQTLHEFRMRAADARRDDLDEAVNGRWTASLREQRSRIAQLSSLFDGLGNLDKADTARLSERIAVLELELRALTEQAEAHGVSETSDASSGDEGASTTQ